MTELQKIVFQPLKRHGQNRLSGKALLVTGAVVFSLCLSTAYAQIDQAVVQHDLQTIFHTTAPQPLLTHADNPIARRIQPLQIRQAGYLVSTLKPWQGHPGALSMTVSGSNEHSIRPNARTVDGLAIMVRSLPDEAFPTTLTREMCRKNAIGILKFILYTHGAGGLKCSDGKQWHNQWQSALWANSAGLGCWLLWDDLDPEMQWLAAKMVCSEADRFVDQAPPSGVKNDTKAEENAWNSTVITLAACMFPHHPHHQAWLKAARLWGVSSFMRQADLAAFKITGLAPADPSKIAVTLHDDYTMENHNRVHPDYMNTININLNQWIPYSWAGMQLPAAFEFNNEKVFDTLKALTFPDAGYIYVNGQDWQLHRNCNWFVTFMLQAIFNGDKGAAMLGRRALEVAERMMARTPDGGMFLPEEYSFPSTQMDVLEMYGRIYLAICARGGGVTPLDEQQYRADLAGNYLYHAGKFAIARTGHSFASFSWGDHVMGLVMPLDRDMLLAPNERSLIGRISLDGVKDERPRIVQAQAEETSGNLIVTGEMMRAGDNMRQRFAFVSLRDGRAIYVDTLTVEKPVRNAEVHLGALSVLNDPHWVYHNGTRDVYGAEGKRTFNVLDKSVTPGEMSSPWYNVDDMLGVVVASSSGHQFYTDNKTIGNGRLEQLFYLNNLPHVEKAEASAEPLTRTALVLLPGADHNETAATSAKTHGHWTSAYQCDLTLNDGTTLNVDFTTSHPVQIKTKPTQ